MNNVTIVIPTARADLAMLLECVSSLLATKESVKIDIRVSRSPGLAINRAVASNYQDDIVLVNDDAMIISWGNWLLELQTAMVRNHADIAAPLIWGVDGKVQHAAGSISVQNGKLVHSNRESVVETLCTFCPMTFCYITRKAWTQIGLLDTLKHDCHFSDVDWMMRANEAGLRMVYVPQVCVMHRGSATLAQRPDFETQRYEDHVAFNEKWGIK